MISQPYKNRNLADISCRNCGWVRYQMDVNSFAQHLEPIGWIFEKGEYCCFSCFKQALQMHHITRNWGETQMNAKTLLHQVATAAKAIHPCRTKPEHHHAYVSLRKLYYKLMTLNPYYFDPECRSYCYGYGKSIELYRQNTKKQLDHNLHTARQELLTCIADFLRDIEAGHIQNITLKEE